MSAFRKLLVVLLLTGIAGLDQTGTLATFTAYTTNAGSTFATGTLVLSNQRNNQAVCFSTNGGSTDDNHNENCMAVFSLALQDGGGSNARITLINEGDLDASKLTIHWTDGTTPCTTIDADTADFHGDGDLCDKLQLQVQEYASDAQQDSNDRTGGTCWFGNNAGGEACGWHNNQDLAAFSAFDGEAPVPDVIDMGPMAAGATRWFRFYLRLPPGQVTNDLMGRKVDWGFTWILAQ